jgi:hypothetical protein
MREWYGQYGCLTWQFSQRGLRIGLGYSNIQFAQHHNDGTTEPQFLNHSQYYVHAVAVTQFHYLMLANISTVV